MDEDALRRLLDAVQVAVTTDDALDWLRRLPYADIGFARADHHRALRQEGRGRLWPGQDPRAVRGAIVYELLAAGDGGPVLLTRADDAQTAEVLDRNPGGERTGTTVVWRPAAPRPETIVVATAGTADLPVAEECAATLAAHGLTGGAAHRRGVAGVHRLLASADVDADAVVVVAGMEVALASLVGGITPPRSSRSPPASATAPAWAA